MVMDGVHVLTALALVALLFDARRPEPYLVAVLAAAVPDVDKFVFDPLVRLDYVQGAVWAHRGVTHSLLFGLLLVLALSYLGPWRAAAVGFGSHVAFDFLTGGVLLFAPFDPTLYGLSYSWLLANILVTTAAVAVLVAALVRWRYDPAAPAAVPSREAVRERLPF
jgi:inner membrane protein